MALPQLPQMTQQSQPQAAPQMPQAPAQGQNPQAQQINAMVQQLMGLPEITDEQLMQLAQMVMVNWKIQQAIQLAKSKGMNNKQIIQAALYAEQQAGAGAKMMPNLKQRLME
jgi:hypothetical protein